MSQTQANLVEVRGIRFSRGDRVIFDDISLSVRAVKLLRSWDLRGSARLPCYA
ncbi:putative ABC transporter ATP-binding protein YrbF [Klebsiella pneumoniae]|uniref:Putative ABC transporter ATP-binding protein YrbF n=1 Tax=Klebsiella pneumoniae TaxID=573 RepID=A0A2X3CLD2_KLEPN|nr:putative ABC transporter ATP-binding protein YrbF [Klebsiella pneumoniae]